MSKQWKRYSRLCLYRFICLVAIFVFIGLALVTFILWQDIVSYLILLVASLTSLSLMRYFQIQARKLYRVVTPEEVLGPNWQLPEEKALKILEEYKKEHETQKEMDK